MGEVRDRKVLFLNELKAAENLIIDIEEVTIDDASSWGHGRCSTQATGIKVAISRLQGALKVAEDVRVGK